MDRSLKSAAAALNRDGSISSAAAALVRDLSLKSAAAALKRGGIARNYFDRTVASPAEPSHLRSTKVYDSLILNGGQGYASTSLRRKQHNSSVLILIPGSRIDPRLR